MRKELKITIKETNFSKQHTLEDFLVQSKPMDVAVKNVKFSFSKIEMWAEPEVDSFKLIVVERDKLPRHITTISKEQLLAIQNIGMDLSPNKLFEILGSLNKSNLILLCQGILEYFRSRLEKDYDIFEIV